MYLPLRSPTLLHLSISSCLYLFVSLSLSLSVSPSPYFSVSVSPNIAVSVCTSLCICISQYHSISFYLSLYLPIYLSTFSLTSYLLISYASLHIRQEGFFKKTWINGVMTSFVIERSFLRHQRRRFLVQRRFVDVRWRRRFRRQSSTWCHCYKTFYNRNLQMFWNKLECFPWQAFPAQSNVCG